MTPPRLSLCLLTWNEIEGCKGDVPMLPRDAFDEIYAVDGGSTDGTVEYLQAQGIPVFKQETKGYNGAYISAFLHCNTDAVVLFHPKGSIDPQTLRRFRPYFAQGYDLVIASRIISGAVNEEDSKLLRPRKWFVQGLAIISALLWKRGQPMIWDMLHGYRGMRKDAFQSIDLLPTGLAADLEMIVRGYRLKQCQVEFPVEEKPRPSGETHFKAWPTGKKLLAYIRHELTRPAPRRA
jgi:glycosyltransferase involved in cell wall biosynthesis